MCGIAGIYSFKRQGAGEAIQHMADAMAHRGPDADGFYKDDTVSLGHRRLSIIDLSEKGNQPLYDDTNNYVIIFNGEIYNYQALKAKLREYPFRTNSDTEVVLAAYLTWGEKAVEQLVGMFAFAVYHKPSGKLFIARDRLGVKPVYYYQDAQYFIFASEIRALLASGLVPKKMDHAALQNYLKTQSFGAPHSIIENVQQLEAGHYLAVEENSVAQRQYWNIEQPSVKIDIQDRAATQKEVYRLLQQSVERRLVSDVPVAAFLSGGIDSSAVVGLMAQFTHAPQTFNIAFNEAAYDESAYAEMVAAKFNTRHHKILLKPDLFLEELPNALNAMDIPSGDGVNSYVVSKEIKKNGIKVAISGVGGDELFAGYPGFKQWYSSNQRKWIWNIPKPIRQLGAFFLPANHKNERIKTLLRQDKLSIDNFYQQVRQVLSPKDIANLLGKTTAYKTKELQVDAFPLLSQYSIAELKGYTHHTLLKDTDQFSMAVSLEVREPFFDHELIEYVLQIPDHIKYPHYPKQLLVESLGGLLPSEIVHRPKKGFTFPWEHWLRNELKQFCADHIKSLANRDFIHGEYALAMWSSFLTNSGTRWSEIWLLVVLEYWMQKNID